MKNNSQPVNTLLVHWQERLNRAEVFKQHLSKSYYQNYLANIAPEVTQGEVKHFTLQSLINSPCTITINHKGSILPVLIPYFDIFIFSDGVGIFAFKAETSQEHASYENLSFILNHIRNPTAELMWDNEKLSVSGFIKKNLTSVLSLKEDWDRYIPQLKSYTLIDDPSATAFNESLDRKLFELAHVLPVGSSVNTEYAPAPEYYNEVVNNAISVYDNWKAIALFDTFTRISCSYTDTYNAWENEYFLIYIHSLYTKFMLYRFNGQLKDVYTVSKQTKTIRNRFIEFVNDYHLAYISYKFLPNLLYEKINQSLEIQKELDRMETKIERIHESNQEKKGQQMNTLLLLISLLSILSVITDLSQWLTEMGLPEQIVYSPVVPFYLIGIVVLIGIWLFRKT